MKHPLSFGRCWSISMTLLILLSGYIIGASKVQAQTRVVVVPLGSTTGNAMPSDVVKGKTFSSTHGEGLTGTLVQHPMGQSYTNTIGMTFNLIPAGTFFMGSPLGEPGRLEDETQHQVTLTQPFYMQITEVTNKQWNTLIFDTGLGAKPSTSHTGDNYPVENVNWYEAAYFANRLSFVDGFSQCYVLSGCTRNPGSGMVCSSVSINSSCTGYRLPTEAQWEYAARAGTTTAYANPVIFDATDTETWSGFNGNLHAIGWYSYNRAMQNSGGTAAYEFGTKPVAAKQANRWGLFDMHGNVFEWCRDWYGTYLGSISDPTGAASGSDRVLRGGSWNRDARYCRAAFREWDGPSLRVSDIGFRLALLQGQ